MPNNYNFPNITEEAAESLAELFFNQGFINDYFSKDPYFKNNEKSYKKLLYDIYKQLCGTAGIPEKNTDFFLNPINHLDAAIVDILNNGIYKNLTLTSQVLNPQSTSAMKIEMLINQCKAILARRLRLVAGNQLLLKTSFFDLIEQYQEKGCSKMFAGILLLIDLQEAYQLFSGENCYQQYLLPWDPDDSPEEKERLVYKSLYHFDDAKKENPNLEKILCPPDQFYSEQFQISKEFRKKLTSNQDYTIPLVSIVNQLITSMRSIIRKISMQEPDDKPHFLAYVEVCITLLKNEIRKKNREPVGKTLVALLTEYKSIYGQGQDNTNLIAAGIAGIASLASSLFFQQQATTPAPDTVVNNNADKTMMETSRTGSEKTPSSATHTPPPVVLQTVALKPSASKTIDIETIELKPTVQPAPSNPGKISKLLENLGITTPSEEIEEEDSKQEEITQKISSLKVKEDGGNPPPDKGKQIIEEEKDTAKKIHQEKMRSVFRDITIFKIKPATGNEDIHDRVKWLKKINK